MSIITLKVVSTSGVHKSSTVTSTLSCSVNKNCIEILKQSCSLIQESPAYGKTTDYCSLTLKISCPPRNVQSCNCISNEYRPKNMHCYVFPILRKVANYNNRSRMQTKAKGSAKFCIQSGCPACSCRKCCSYAAARCPIQIPTLKPQCCCNSCAPKGSSPEEICCPKPHPPPCSTVVTKGCAHCCEVEDNYIESYLVR